MLAVANPVPADTGFTRPLLAVYQHVDKLRTGAGRREEIM